MQGLVHYSDDSSPEASSSHAGPSRLRDQIPTASPSNFPKLLKSQIRPPSGIVLTPKSPKRLRPSSPTPTPISTSISQNSRSKSSNSTPRSNGGGLPENLTHTAQSDISKSELASKGKDKGKARLSDQFEGLTDEEIFRVVMQPDEIEGVDNWGIPDEVDPDEADGALQTKVEHFLKLKFENGEHINTRLLSSSAFANPHIYSKLVEFVSIDERSTNFPSAGWLTRRNLESLIPIYGPSDLSAQQKAKQDAVKAAQSIGQRREITFAPGKHRDRDESKKRDRNGWEKDDRYSHKHDHGHSHKERDRRDRDRKRDRR